MFEALFCELYETLQSLTELIVALVSENKDMYVIGCDCILRRNFEMKTLNYFDEFVMKV